MMVAAVPKPSFIIELNARGAGQHSPFNSSLKRKIDYGLTDRELLFVGFVGPVKFPPLSWPPPPPAPLPMLAVVKAPLPSPAKFTIGPASIDCETIPDPETETLVPGATVIT